MANADGRLFNVDRWTIYTLQRLQPNKRYRSRYVTWSGDHLRLTSAQYRRMKKKMNKRNDFSIGLYTPAMTNKYPKSQRDNVLDTPKIHVNRCHDDCTCE